VNCKGFTLLEVVVTLIVAGILGAMLFQIVHFSAVNSAEPVARLSRQVNLVDEMEKMTACYKGLIEDGALTLSAFESSCAPSDPEVAAEFTYGEISGGAFTPTGPGSGMVKVTLQAGGQSLSVLFTE